MKKLLLLLAMTATLVQAEHSDSDSLLNTRKERIQFLQGLTVAQKLAIESKDKSEDEIKEIINNFEARINFPDTSAELLADCKYAFITINKIFKYSKITTANSMLLEEKELEECVAKELKRSEAVLKILEDQNISDDEAEKAAVRFGRTVNPCFAYLGYIARYGGSQL